MNLLFHVVLHTFNYYNYVNYTITINSIIKLKPFDVYWCGVIIVNTKA